MSCFYPRRTVARRPNAEHPRVFPPESMGPVVATAAPGSPQWAAVGPHAIPHATFRIPEWATDVPDLRSGHAAAESWPNRSPLPAPAPFTSRLGESRCGVRGLVDDEKGFRCRPSPEVRLRRSRSQRVGVSRCDQSHTALEATPTPEVLIAFRTT